MCLCLCFLIKQNKEKKTKIYQKSIFYLSFLFLVDYLWIHVIWFVVGVGVCVCSVMMFIRWWRWEVVVVVVLSTNTRICASGGYFWVIHSYRGRAGRGFIELLMVYDRFELFVRFGAHANVMVMWCRHIIIIITYHFTLFFVTATSSKSSYTSY